MENEEHLSLDELVDKFAEAEPKFIEPEPDLEDEPQDEEEEENVDEVEDDDEEEGSDPGDDAGGEDQDQEDPETEIEVEGTTHKVKRSELVKLFADREAIAARTSAVFEQNRAVEAHGMYLAKLYDARIEQAKANLDKYAKIDLFQAYRELSADEFETLKAAKEAAEAEWATVNSEAQQFVQNAQNTRKAFLREQAKASIGTIRSAIPEWDDGVYNKVRSYAVSQGMDASVVNEIVDASTIIMMHKAMLYDDAKSKTEKVTKKVVKAPKKVAKKGDEAVNTETTKAKRLVHNARLTGSIDDVTEAFLAARRS